MAFQKLKFECQFSPLHPCAIYSTFKEGDGELKGVDVTLEFSTVEIPFLKHLDFLSSWQLWRNINFNRCVLAREGYGRVLVFVTEK